MRTAFEKAVSDAAPADANRAWERLSTERAGPESILTSKVTERGAEVVLRGRPVAPVESVPRSTVTSPTPAGTIPPASSPAGSVRAVPFHLSVPGT